MTDKYFPITVEEAMKFADRAKNEGHPEIADIFYGIAEKIALFNEQNTHTVEELRQKVGEETFKQILGGPGISEKDLFRSE
jgi:rubrerythrin